MNDGQVPHRPINGEEVCMFSAIANQVGFGSNHFTIRMISEFCLITSAVGERMFLDAQYDELYPKTEETTVDEGIAEAA
jgi:hypothetical protein